MTQHVFYNLPIASIWVIWCFLCTGLDRQVIFFSLFRTTFKASDNTIILLPLKDQTHMICFAFSLSSFKLTAFLCDWMASWVNEWVCEWHRNRKKRHEFQKKSSSIDTDWLLVDRLPHKKSVFYISLFPTLIIHRRIQFAPEIEPFFSSLLCFYQLSNIFIVWVRSTKSVRI